MGDTTSPVYVTDWQEIRALTRCLPKGLLHTTREIYHLIAGHVGKSGAAFVSIKTLAEESDMHEGNVRKARADLERAGLIDTMGGGGNQSNVYRLIDFRLSTPRAHRRGVTPRPPARDPAPTGAKPRAHRRDVEVEEELKEGAGTCACGSAVAPGRWRCQACQEQVNLGRSKLDVMLGLGRDR